MPRRFIVLALALLPACGSTWSSDSDHHCLDIVRYGHGRHTHLEYYRQGQQIDAAELYSALAMEPSSHDDARAAGVDGIAARAAAGVMLSSALGAFASGYALDREGRSHESVIVASALGGVAAVNAVVAIATIVGHEQHLRRALRDYNEHDACRTPDHEEHDAE